MMLKADMAFPLDAKTGGQFPTESITILFFSQDRQKSLGFGLTDASCAKCLF